jgi:membrane protease YdiL (CAAX protease family)
VSVPPAPWPSKITFIVVAGVPASYWHRLQYLGYKSVADVAFVFAVGLLFGWIVAKTRSLLSVALSQVGEAEPQRAIYVTASS